MFVSDEDTRSGIRTGIIRPGTPDITKFNGVDLKVFLPRDASPGTALSLKRSHGIDDDMPVVVIVGLIVREKGYREFLEMARHVLEKRKVDFLVVGDTLTSDRDPFGPVFREDVAVA